ncbi:cytochrome P450 [Artomyces pyxidatus]|uniref:Cytochrome P450 n=1 Tax=Artomyces pyxidatus TaxID=48021 RepID=A0ACB8T3J8_9AGAM|nr:cytochrome P450 [Artomyces pyxidatus]
MPRKHEWKTFTLWRKTYGDIVYLNILGRPLIILNTFETATDLMEKRSSKYSDRPRFPLVDLVGHDFNFGFMHYNKRWHACRRVFASQFGKASLPGYYRSHQAAVSTLLNNLLEDPDHFVDHLRLHAGQLIMDVTYGIPIKTREDPLIKTAEAVMSTISIAVSPVMWVYNPIPLLQSLPSWLGGKNFMSQVWKWQSDVQDLQNVPFEMAKASMSALGGRSFFIANLLQGMDDNASAEQETLIRDCAAVSYGGGSDTTTAISSIFILAMLRHPDIQKAAQSEIDRVVGSHRLPNFSDRARLPYVTAVMMEVLRWHPSSPQGIPHTLAEDDEYKGYRIPAGSVVIGSIWGILHDPEIYPDPVKFEPERYIVSGELDCSRNDPTRIAFGFGRRICPGKHFSEDTLWLLMARILATFNIEPVDADITIPVDFTSGAISHPTPFSCVIRPRSEASEDLIRNSEIA